MTVFIRLCKFESDLLHVDLVPRYFMRPALRPSGQRYELRPVIRLSG